MSRPLLVALGVLLASCASSQYAWEDLQGEDPEPSGPPELRAYKESHYRALGREFVAAGEWPAVERALSGKSVLFLGDHHDDLALHAAMLDAVRRLARSGKKLALGLEAIGIEDEGAVQRWLGGGGGIAELAAVVRRRWPESWLDGEEVDAAFYRTLLEVARAERIPVFALEPAPRLPLAERDPCIAARVRAAHARMPDRLLVVVVGHTHLLGEGKLVARSALPSVVIGARASRSLVANGPPRGGEGPFLRTDAGVWLFRKAGTR